MSEKRKRVTVAMDPATYKALRQLGLDIGKTNQDMMIEAIKEYMARWNKA